MTLPEAFPAPEFFVRDSAPSLRWAVLAPGGIAVEFVRALLRFTDQRVVAVGSRSRDRAAAFAARFEIPHAFGSYEEVVERGDVDVVYIASPVSEHVRLGLLAVGAGKHVLVEKPLATTAHDARRLFAAAEDAGVFAMEAMWTRYLPQSSVIRRLLADGVLGEVESVLADHGQAVPRDPSRRLWRPELGGGALGDIGIYPIAFASEMLGAPTQILAQGMVTSTGVDAWATIALDHDGNAHAALSAGLLTRTPIVATVAGSAARVELASPFFMPTSFRLADTALFGESRLWREPTGMTGFDGLSWEATALARYVDEERVESPLHTHEETISILATIDEARRQIHDAGRVVR
ncbi:Gfo/Idh/MocA family oxidoreductase [Microbacterium aquimaris]|uniref:Gfo/Idh/MocA family protein n=1 Tax=Microbacterium aquimaris TaxID=459816 RepID=UPI002AD240C0|nr:Gfo/Idh/MocA family oxidoreductase [Microbacterium aquimaris]MDZ8275228.1 Gfo/Idh/MocA family oxidoreductase [Microbacterium aquimaris]